jgi:hypothetical protein
VYFKGPSGFFGQFCEYFIPTGTTTLATTTLSTKTTKMTSTTAISTSSIQSVAPCGTNIANVCKNNAQCFIINNSNLFCLCAYGYTGI